MSSYLNNQTVSKAAYSFLYDVVLSVFLMLHDPILHW